MKFIALICIMIASAEAIKDVSQDVGPDEFAVPPKQAIPIKEPELIKDPIVPKPEIIEKPVVINEPIPQPNPIHGSKYGATIVISKPVHPVAPIISPPVPIMTTEEKAERIRVVGKNLASFLTAKLSAPVLISSSKTSAIAGSLPLLLAKKGAVLGTLIATPLQWKLSALSSLHAAANGALVSVPVAVGTGIATGTVYAKEKLDHLHNIDISAHVHSGLNHLKNGAVSVGHILFKPAVLTAAKTSALVGGGLSAMGATAEHLGNGLVMAGNKMGTAGAAMKMVSGQWVASSLGKWSQHPLLSWLPASGAHGQVYVVDTPFIQIIKNVPVVQSGAGAMVKPAPTVIASGHAIAGVQQKLVEAALPSNEAYEYDIDRRMRTGTTKNENRTKRSVDNSDGGVLPVDRAIRLMKALQIQDCIARVICELSCDLKHYGDNGKKVFNNLLSLQMSEHSKNPDFDIYRQSLIYGRRYGSKRDDNECSKCSSLYPSCKASTDDLIAVASMVKVQ